MSETLFIADLHLSENRPELTHAFLHFLKHRARSAMALFILGDFFDFWVGDDCIEPWQVYIARSLKEYSKTHKLYFMRGNRDFLIGERFCQQAGLTLLPDHHIIQLANTPTLLLHGDTLCTKDRHYRYYRAIAHHRLTRKLFRMLPKRLRHKIACRIRIISKNSNKNDNTQNDIVSIKDAQPEAVIKAMHKYKVTCMIHGHTHRPAQHKQSLNTSENLSAKGTRWVLGDWGTHWWVLSYQNGFFAQESYPIKKQPEIKKKSNR